ncbi:Retrovirus-related Pol polyprotein from transposon TNT 1-94 [Abeliophyllum distichum]|uniref:Retrovirus-related Pol polyprotein from transposon TNT 1-94 n=1 Tax=Abeliophyllum distichum TaxID=126358 RepID=A0ABD1URL7_9LAMI
MREKNGEIYFVRGRPQSRGLEVEVEVGKTVVAIERSDHGHVVAWAGVAYRITGVGNITVKFDSGFVHTLRKVRYVPHMGRNLISIGELDSTGFMDRLGNGMIRMCKGALRAFKATRRNSIYITHAEVMSGLNSTISSIDTDHTQKWHNTLAHVSIKGLKFLNDKGVFGKDQELVNKEPNIYVEAIKSEKSVEWFSTMKGETSFLVRNQTWDLVPKPKNKSIVGCKWIYKVKKGTTESEPVRYEARLVAKGQWYRMFDSLVFYISYKRNEFDNCLYYLHHSSNDDCVYLLLYVDDMLLDGPNMKVVNKISV